MPDNAVINPYPTITLSEVIDIIFVAILLYTAIVWPNAHEPFFVVRGIVIWEPSTSSSIFGPPNDGLVFQGFFADFFDHDRRIFQEELRQLFEQIAVWRLARKRIPPLVQPRRISWSDLGRPGEGTRRRF